MFKKILLVISVLIILIWLKTPQINYELIRERDWKVYDVPNVIFRDVLSFKPNYQSPFNVDDNGYIYSNDTVFVGKIIQKTHNYVNMYITIQDSSNHEVKYISNF